MDDPMMYQYEAHELGKAVDRIKELEEQLEVERNRTLRYKELLYDHTDHGKMIIELKEALDWATFKVFSNTSPYDTLNPARAKVREYRKQFNLDKI